MYLTLEFVSQALGRQVDHAAAVEPHVHAVVAPHPIEVVRPEAEVVRAAQFSILMPCAFQAVKSSCRLIKI